MCVHACPYDALVKEGAKENWKKRKDGTTAIQIKQRLLKFLRQVKRTRDRMRLEKEGRIQM